MKVHIDRCSSTSPMGLYMHYPSVEVRQPVLMKLSLTTGALWCEVWALHPSHLGKYSDPGVVWWEIPIIQPDTANELMEAVAPAVQRILDGTYRAEAAINQSRRFDEDAEFAIREVRYRIWQQNQDLYVVAADEHFGPIRDQLSEIMKRSGDISTAADIMYSHYQNDGRTPETPFVTDIGWFFDRLQNEILEERNALAR